MSGQGSKVGCLRVVWVTSSAVELNLPEGGSLDEGEALKIVEKYVT